MNARKTLGLLVLLALSGCVSEPPLQTPAEDVNAEMTQGLTALRGLDIQTVVAQFGYPTSEQIILGTKVLTWSQRWDSQIPMPTTSYGTAMVGSTPIMTSTVDTTMVPVTAYCSAQLGIDAAGTIINTYWQGKQVGCRNYAHALIAFARQTGRLQ